MIRLLYSLLLLFGTSLFSEEADPPQLLEESKESFCYFHPPKGWEIAQSTSPHVKMAFVKKDKKEGFCPSINLAIEEVGTGSLSDYLNAVKAIYEQNRNNRWRKLGKVHTGAGDAQLTEIDTISQLGSVRMLQLIFLKDGRAHILTAAALKNDFCAYYRDFQEAFRSFTITQDLLEPIPQLQRKVDLKNSQESLLQASAEEEFEKKHWAAFESKIREEYEDMGLFWQALVLKHYREMCVEKIVCK